MNPNYVLDLTTEELASSDTFIPSAEALDRMYSYIMEHTRAIHHYEDYRLASLYMDRLHNEVQLLQRENERLKNRSFIGRIKKMIRK